MYIKPCGICGNNRLLVEGEGWNAYIKCYKCNKNMRGGFSKVEHLVSKWNEYN